jgi:putative ABC transport system permease protein
MWKRRRSAQDFSEEIQSHLAMEVDRLRQEGLSEEEAAFAARRAMGNLTAIEERFHEANHWRWLDQLRQDARVCLRQWRRRPLTAAAALLTIALGTGLNVAIFRVVWSALLKPLPYADAAQLVQVWTAADRRLPDGSTIQMWQSRSRSFRTLASFRPWRATVGGGGDPERVPAGAVSAEFLPALGARTALGRVFAAEEVRPGTDDVVVLSYGYWKTRFGGGRSLVANSIPVDGRHCRVIGVLAPDFRDLVMSGANPPVVYFPISKLATGPLKVSSGRVIGRLRNGVGIEAARSELEALALQAGTDSQGIRITRLGDDVGYSVRPALLVMFAGAGCLLLIACTNVANLLLAQAIGRRQELAIRAAIGAGRMRLVRQLLTEALVLSFSGVLLGLCAAWAFCRTMVALYPGTLPRIAEGGGAGIVLLFAVSLATLSAAFFGVLPALLVTREPGDASLRAGRGGTMPAAGRWREALIGLQVATTATLLIGAGLLAKSFVTLRSVDPGFKHDNLFTAQVALPERRYRTEDDRIRFARAWVESLKRIPGAQSAAITNSLPLAFNVLWDVQFAVSGLGVEHRTGGRAVMGDYFEALGLRMKEGRALTAADDGRRDVVVVNESFVRSYLKSVPPVGAVLRFGPKQATVVGVVRDLRTLGLRQSARPEIYMPFAALTSPILDVVVRSAVPPAEITAAARARLRELDPSLALAQVSTMERIVDGEFAQPRFQAALLGLFAAVAVVLATVGIYGVIAHAVRARTREFGVRLALGATEARVFRLVVKQGLRAPLIGLAIGLAIAALTARVLQAFLFGVTPRDPLVFASAGALLVVVCVSSCALPARQASRTDAAHALRDE